MKSPSLLAALGWEAIFAKSKMYIQRALRCKGRRDLDEYQLWASLALELLRKTSLARVHPSLIVNPLDHVSILAASGFNLGTDIKTITAHTLYERLRHVTKGFDESVKKFCDDISQRRNAELHSGDIPFKAMKLEAWESQYWHAAQLILDFMESSLEKWLGADQARAPKKLLAHASQALIDAVLVRVERAKVQFLKRKKKEREEAIALSMNKESYRYPGRLWQCGDEGEWGTKCPACGGKAVVTGSSGELSVWHYDEDGYRVEGGFVTKEYVAEKFKCPVCDLHLTSQAEIEAAGLHCDHDEHIDYDEFAAENWGSDQQYQEALEYNEALERLKQQYK
jgi:hypothetical protein